MSALALAAGLEWASAPSRDRRSAVSARDLARARKSDLPLPVDELTAFFPLLEAAGLLGPAPQAAV